MTPLPLPRGHRGSLLCPGALTWLAAGSLWDGGQGPAGPARTAGKQDRGYSGRTGICGVQSGWAGAAGRCSQAWLCPLECAASSSFSQRSPCSLLFPTPGLPGCVLWHCGASPTPAPPRPDISLVPSPRTLTQPPPHHNGDPQPCCQRGRERAAASPCIQKEPSGGPGLSRHLGGIPAAASRARGRHGEGAGRGLSAPGVGPGGGGSSLDPHLCLLCPLSPPRDDRKLCLTQTCPRAGSAPAGTEPGAEGHPHPGAHPALPAPPRLLPGARVLRR